jgi:hypothetical protein
LLSLILTQGERALTQKSEPLLAQIRPRVERDRGRLVLSFPGLEDLEVDLTIEEVRQHQQGSMCVGEISLFLHILQKNTLKRIRIYNLAGLWIRIQYKGFGSGCRSGFSKSLYPGPRS